MSYRLPHQARAIHKHAHDMISLAAAASRSRLHTLVIADLNSGFVVHLRGAHTLFYLSSHGEESLLNVRGVLSGCFEEGDTKTVGEFLA